MNVPPEGPSHAGATFGAQIAAEPDEPDFEHVISEDGARVFWTQLSTGIVYARENGTKTVQVSAHQARYQTATPDGRYVFYIEERQLWRFDVETEARVALTTPGPEAKVQGVVGISDDGEYVYFVARGELAAGSSYGEENLYLLHAGTTSFIAAPEASGAWGPLRTREAEVTPDGHALVFVSSRSLTGYDNAFEGGQASEVYVYETEGESGRLLCVSCDRSGELPRQPGATSGQLDGTLGSFLPVSWSNTYLPQWISDDGSRVFFDSEIDLVPQDTNGAQDVYEWERDGAGSCQESAGCIYLLSSGIVTSGSWLIGSSASGDDVFIVSRAKLTPEDGGEANVLYDARVDGVPPAPPSGCTGTGCQGLPSAPPVFATPSSVTFDGVGNFPAQQPTLPPAKVVTKSVKCRPGKRLSHGRCVKKKAKKSKAKKSTHRKGSK